MNQVPGNPPPYQQQKKKGLPTIAWVGIGCGTLLVVGLVVGVVAFSMFFARMAKDFTANPEKAGAEMVVNFNPDLEKISEDDEAGTMTIRVKSTGEEITLNYKDLSQGRLGVTGADGSITQIGMGDMDSVPTWVPRLENAEETRCLFHHESEREISGVVYSESRESAERVQEMLEAAVDRDKFSSKSSSTSNFGGSEKRSLEYKGGGRTLEVQITRPKAGEVLSIQVAYKEKK